MNEQSEEKPLDTTTRDIVIGWNKLYRETEIKHSTFFIVLCLLIAIPTLTFSVRYFVEDFALVCFGKGIQAQVVQINEPMSYTFSLNEKTYTGATMGRSSGFRPGDSVTVIYLPNYPECSKIQGMSVSNGFLRLCLTAGVLAMIGAGSLYKKSRMLLLARAASVDPPPGPVSSEQLPPADAMPLSRTE